MYESSRRTPFSFRSRLFAFEQAQSHWRHLNGAMIQGNEETLAKSFKLGFQAAKYWNKEFFFPLSQQCPKAYDPQRDRVHHADKEVRSFISIECINERSRGKDKEAPSAGIELR